MKIICKKTCYGFKERLVEENQVLDITKKDIEELKAKAILQYFKPIDDEAIKAFNPTTIFEKTIKK